MTTVKIDGPDYMPAEGDTDTSATAVIATLKQSEQRLALATEAASIGIWEWDLASGSMTYSQQARSICGFLPDQDVTYEDVRRVTHPDDYPRTSAMAQRALDPRLREEAPYEYRIIRTDGTVIWVMAHGRAVFETVGGQTKATRYVGTLQDITEKRRWEEADRDAKARLDLAIRAGNLAIWEIDLISDEVTGSPELNRILGFPENSFPTAAEMRARYYPGEQERLERLGAEALARGEPTLEAEYRYIWPDGSVRWLWLRAEGILDAKGVPIRAIGVLTDITDRRHADEVLRASEARLRFLDDLGSVTEPLADANAVLEATTKLLGEHLNLSVCAYADMDEDEDGFTIRGDWAAPGSTSIVGHYRLADFGRLAVMNLSSGEPLIVNDNLRELAPEEAATFQSIGIASTICMPLIKQGRLTALMAIHDRVPRVWTEDELSLLREVTTRSWAHVERVGALAELRQSEAALRSLNAELERRVIERTLARGRTWQVSPDLMGALNAQGLFEASNPAWMTVLGWSEAELARRQIWDLIHPEDIERTRAELDLTRQGRPAIGFPNRYLSRDGSYRWIAWTGVFEDGLIYCYGRDITAERERETELAARTSERNRLWTLSPDLLARADYTGRMLAVSPAWTRLLGFSEAGLLGRPYSELIHPDDSEATWAALEQMRKTDAPVRFENRMRTASQDYKPIEWTTAPEPDGLNFIALGRDLSATKVRERELELAQETLRQAQKNEAIGQLTGGVAHDFNNLLMAIMSNLDLLAKRTAGDEKASRLIDGAMQGAQRGATLTQRMLAFARKQELKVAPHDLARLVERADNLLRRSVGDGIDLQLDLAKPVPLALVDDNQLDLALLNLVINARDAMPDGGSILVKVDYRPSTGSLSEPAEGYVCLSVADDGHGMDAETLEKATQPFFSTKGVGKGTGLGLSMIQGLAQQLNGRLYLNSAVGHGTTAELWLPATKATQAGAHATSATTVAVPDKNRSLRILLVDDDVLIAMSTVDLLEDLGHVVVPAYSGLKALEILERDVSFDLMITDFSMPKMNGSDLALAARKILPNLPILLATGYAELPGNAAIKLPQISKPYLQRQLQAAIETLIDAA